MSKKMNYYTVVESGGFIFSGNGKSYPEGWQGDLQADGWHKSDIEAALRGGLIIVAANLVAMSQLPAEGTAELLAEEPNG